MKNRNDKKLLNWVANTNRHCRANRLSNFDLGLLNEAEIIDLANLCLDHFENEVERRILDAAKKKIPSPQFARGDGRTKNIKLAQIRNTRQQS